MTTSSSIFVVSREMIDDLMGKTTEALHQLAGELNTLDTEGASTSDSDSNRKPIGNDVTKKLLQIVQESPEKTEITAFIFLHWFKSSGVECCKLPLNESQIHEYHPLHPLNTSSSDSQDTQWIVWQKLCALFQQKWVECMLKLTLPKSNTDVCLTMFRYYVECLCVLYESNGVWLLYRRVRRQHIIDLLTQHQLNTSNSGDTTLLNLFSAVITSIISDAEIFAEVTYFDLVITVEDIGMFYIDVITEYVDSLLKELQSNNQQCDSIQSSMYRLHKNMANSPKCKVVLLSPNEETGSTESMLPKVVLHEVGAMIVNCWKLELCVQNAIDSFLSGITPAKNTEVCCSNTKRPANLPKLFQATGHKSQKEAECTTLSTNSPQKGGKWEWRFSFSSYASDLAQLVDEMIRTVALSSLEQECVLMHQTQPIESIEVCEALTNFDGSLPRKVSVPVAAFIETIDSLLPMIVACEEELSPVKNAFIVAVKQYSIEVLNHLLRLSQEALHTQKSYNLYLLISSAAFFCKKMEHYSNIFHDVNSRVFQCEAEQIKELVDTLVQQAIVSQQTHLSTTILQDRESNNWCCTKPFFEDERVSFVVQMWNLHMQALKQDLWTILPPFLTYRILLSVLEHSLTVFARRYSLVKPSYARVRQLRTDITAILLCASEFALSLSSELSNNECFSGQLESLHQKCSGLVAVLAIVTSPLNVLYKVFKKGFPPKHVIQARESKNSSSTTAWLQIYQRELLLPCSLNDNLSPTSNAVAAHLEVLCSQPVPLWPIVVKLLIMRDFTLPLMIVTHCLEPSANHIGQSIKTSCEKLGCERTALCKQISEKSVWLVVTTILAQCHSCPEGLTRVLIHLFERFNLWSVVSANPKVYMQFPVWYLPILEQLEPICVRVLNPALKYMCICGAWDTKQMEELYTYFPSCSSQLTVEAVVKSMTEMLQEVGIMLSILSCPVLHFFANIDSALPSAYVQCKGLSPVIIQVIVTYVYSLLTTPLKIEGLIGKPPRAIELHTLKCVADEFLKAVILIDDTHPMQDHFQKLKILLARLRTEKCKDTGTNFSSNEHIFQILATEIISTVKGCEAMVDFYKMLLANRTWILSNLGLDLPTNIHEIEPTLHFNEDPQVQNQQSLTIFQQHSNFGLYRRDHAAVIGFQYDWTSLLQGNLGLTELSLRFLLSNRWEMQENVQLEESEIKQVQMLQAQFGFDANGLS